MMDALFITCMGVIMVIVMLLEFPASNRMDAGDN